MIIRLKSFRLISDFEKIPGRNWDGKAIQTHVGNSRVLNQEARIQKMNCLLEDTTRTVDLEKKSKASLVEGLGNVVVERAVCLPGIVDLPDRLLVVVSGEVRVADGLPLLEGGEVAGEHLGDVLQDVGFGLGLGGHAHGLHKLTAGAALERTIRKTDSTAHGGENDDPDHGVSLDMETLLSGTGTESLQELGRLGDDVAINSDRPAAREDNNEGAAVVC